MTDVPPFLDRQDEGIKGEDQGRHGKFTSRRRCVISLAINLNNKYGLSENKVKSKEIKDI